MKKTVFFALVLVVGLVLAGCGKTDEDAQVLSGGSGSAAEGGVTEESEFDQGGGQAGEDMPVHKESDGRLSDNSQNYILALGMDYAAESIQALSEHIGESQAIQAMCHGEIVNAVLMPFQAEDVISALYPDEKEDNTLLQINAKYITPVIFHSLMSTFFLSNVNPVEEFQTFRTEYQLLTAGNRQFMAAKPTDDYQDQVLFIFYGNKTSPEAVIPNTD